MEIINVEGFTVF